mmetsp:Transcript_26934/g.84497  ORF Transcript_26934/g.84497 Transcript_26934/m.84497 type:complete len:114 (-) Transcript_26934:89-430(-)
MFGAPEQVPMRNMSLMAAIQEMQAPIMAEYGFEGPTGVMAAVMQVGGAFCLGATPRSCRAPIARARAQLQLRPSLNPNLSSNASPNPDPDPGPNPNPSSRRSRTRATRTLRSS